MATAMANERALIRGAVVRMRARIMATVFGMLGGVGPLGITQSHQPGIGPQGQRLGTALGSRAALHETGSDGDETVDA
jgi:hypothetical protein